MDGANQGAEDTTSPYSTVWNTTTLSNGNHTLTAVARDAAGNTTTATTITVNVNNVVIQPDTTAPGTPTGLANPSKTTTSASLSWNASTDPTVGGATTSGLAGYKLYRNGSATALTTTTLLNFTDSGLTPNTTYTYQITAYDNAGNESAKSTPALSVTTNANLPTVTITANPTSVASGASSTLTWSSTNATTCTASNGWTGTKATSGSQTITNITVGSTYTITCTGTGGSANDSDTVNVVGAPTLNLSANPTTISSGTPSILTWSSTNATTCTASNGWTGTKATSGSQSFSPNTTTTYTLTCTGTGGSANASATVTVTGPAKIGDLNNDNAVNIFDLSILLSRYSTTDTTADINHDGTVNIFDLSILLSHYGT
jgi:YD repeat-containing protein